MTPSSQVAGDEARKTLEDLGLNAATAQQIEQQLAPARPIRPRAAPGRRLEARCAASSFGRLLGARIDANRGRRLAGEILHAAPRFRAATRRSAAAPAARRRTRAEIPPAGRYSSGRIENRPAAVVAQLLVPLDDALPQALDRCELASCMSIKHALRAAGTRTDARFDRRTAAGRTPSPPGLARRSHRDRPFARSDRRESAAGSGGGIRARRPG